jgi:hypothetical protein
MSNDTNQSSGTAVLEAALIEASSVADRTEGTEYVAACVVTRIINNTLRRLAAPTPPDATQEQAGLNEARNLLKAVLMCRSGPHGWVAGNLCMVATSIEDFLAAPTPPEAGQEQDGWGQPIAQPAAAEGEGRTRILEWLARHISPKANSELPWGRFTAVIDRELAAATAAAEARAGEVREAAAFAEREIRAWFGNWSPGAMDRMRKDFVRVADRLAAAVAAGQGERSGNKP